MKKVFFIILFFVVANSFAQYPILIDTILKPGIYKTFEEFRNNNPSIQLSGEIKSKIFKYNSNGSFENLNTYYVDVDKKDANVIGKVFGFSDGKNIFISPLYSSKVNDYEFYILEFINLYSYYCSIESSQVGSIYMEVKVQNVLDIKSGDVLKLTNSTVKDIISTDKQLLEKFKNQKSKYLYYKQYLLDFLKK